MNSARRSCSRRARARTRRNVAMPGPDQQANDDDQRPVRGRDPDHPSRVGAYVRSRMANQILNAISGIATVRRAPLDFHGL